MGDDQHNEVERAQGALPPIQDAAAADSTIQRIAARTKQEAQLAEALATGEGRGREILRDTERQLHNTRVTLARRNTQLEYAVKGFVAAARWPSYVKGILATLGAGGLVGGLAAQFGRLSTGACVGSLVLIVLSVVLHWRDKGDADTARKILSELPAHQEDGSDAGP